MDGSWQSWFDKILIPQTCDAMLIIQFGTASLEALHSASSVNIGSGPSVFF